MGPSPRPVRFLVLAVVAYFGAETPARVDAAVPNRSIVVRDIGPSLARYAPIVAVTRDESWCSREEDPQTTNPSYCDQFFACSVSRILCQMDARTGSYEVVYAGECPSCQPFVNTGPSSSNADREAASALNGFAFSTFTSFSIPPPPNGVVTTAAPQRVSVAAGATQATGGGSITPAISADGRFIAFDSSATNLVPGDANGKRDVFVYDRVLAQIERVSINSAGAESTGDSIAAAISADGRFVAFVSQAANLVASDTNNQADVFVHDRQTDQTERVNIATNGAQMFGGSWPAPSTFQYATAFIDGTEVAISADGRYVAFVSGRPEFGVPQVFVRDRQAAVTKQVSVWSNGDPMVSGSMPNTTARPRVAISADGRIVAFDTLYPLDAADTNANRDVYVHDLLTSSTSRVSVDSAGAQANAYSGWPSISGDGRFVAFVSEGGGLAAEGSGYRNVLVRDRLAGTTTWVPFTFGARTNAPAISADGRRIAAAVFTVIPPTFTTWRADIVVYDLVSTSRRVVSQINGTTPPDASSFGPAISADGSVIAYASAATNLVAADSNGQDDVFVSEVPGNLVLNGTFDQQASHWLSFSLPSANELSWRVNAGVFEFYRRPGSTQGVVLQNTNIALPADVGLLARFDLGNTAGNRRRVSVLVHDGDFTDLSVCTFWLAANAPMRTYYIRTHSTKNWTNATISFYAATVGADTGIDSGYYRVDDVVLEPMPLGTDRRTECDDPTAPLAPGGASGLNLVANGTFSSGLPPWILFGQIVHQIAAGVFEFYRPVGTPSGVVLQPTGQPMTTNQIVTSVFKLGNSSGVRKRVTVLLHDLDFSDMAACTFWLSPGQPLSTYVMRTFATKDWTNATVSFYPATVGTETWIRLDDVALHRTPSIAVSGTDCLEPPGPPGASIAVGSGAAARRALGASMPSQSAAAASPGSQRSGSVEGAAARNLSGRQVVTDIETVEIAPDRVIRLNLESWLLDDKAVAELQISIDGGAWITVLDLSAADGRQRVELSLGGFVGHRVRLRVVIGP